MLDLRFKNESNSRRSKQNKEMVFSGWLCLEQKILTNNILKYLQHGNAILWTVSIKYSFVYNNHSTDKNS